MATRPEQQWALAAAGGDQAALAKLLETIQHRVYTLVLRMVSHRDDAAEVTQDVLLKIVQNISVFKGQSDVRTWAIRIAMNQSISHLRKRKLRRTASLDQQAEEGPTPPGREPDPAWNVQQRESLDHLRVALSRVEESFRGVLVLRDIEQMDYQQISQVLDLPAGTVKSRLFRARLALRQEMMALEGTPVTARPGVTP
ncbi:MAG: RNA polymerase sigma factor [Phycisphaeraceae bacterium]|nr:RNA polymerase sigma factor [Phycisphaeraceae bacterium]